MCKYAYIFAWQANDQSAKKHQTMQHLLFKTACLHIHLMWVCLNILNIPSDMTAKEIKLPIAPNKMIVMKFRKNCFFFTWNLNRKKKGSGQETKHQNQSLTHINCSPIPTLKTICPIHQQFTQVNKYWVKWRPGSKW